MSGGGKGGSQTSSTQIPDWMAAPIQRQIGSIERTQGLGYTPYYGPDVAAINPQEIAAMGNTNMAANAFGLGSAGLGDITGALPTARTFSDGVSAYSGGNLFDQARNELALRSPAQAAALAPTFPTVATTQTTSPTTGYDTTTGYNPTTATFAPLDTYDPVSGTYTVPDQTQTQTTSPTQEPVYYFSTDPEIEGWYYDDNAP
jgi:hypothetical protein